MSSATKHDANVRAEVRVARVLSGPLRIRRQTPLVPVAKADLDLCRRSHEAAPASVTRRVIVPTLADPAEKARASIRSAFRPKPNAGGAYSVVGSTPEEKVTHPERRTPARRPRNT